MKDGKESEKMRRKWRRGGGGEGGQCGDKEEPSTALQPAHSHGQQRHNAFSVTAPLPVLTAASSHLDMTVILLAGSAVGRWSCALFAVVTRWYTGALQHNVSRDLTFLRVPAGTALYLVECYWSMQ